MLGLLERMMINNLLNTNFRPVIMIIETEGIFLIKVVNVRSVQKLMVIDVKSFHDVTDIEAQGDVRLVAVDQGQVCLAKLGSKEVCVNDGAKNGVKVG